MKAWVVYPKGDDWCTLIHAETRGKAIQKVMDIYDPDWYSFIDYKALRKPGLDGKSITYDNALDAGFRYVDSDDQTRYLPKEYFINDCRCEICKGE